MEDDLDLQDFPHVSRLFPLPGVVLFPHAVLPLHIFEPRYRQMTEDALATDKLITIVQLRPSDDLTDPDQPPLEKFGCIGRIFKHERLPDGRYNFLLLGRKRVRLDREVDNGKLYRSSEVTICEDVEADGDERSLRGDLIAAFRKSQAGALDPELDSLLEKELPLGILADIVAQSIGASPEIKQKFLDEPRVGRRVARLIARLKAPQDSGIGGAGGQANFPPPFSQN